jgi:hypothetical protein
MTALKRRLQDEDIAQDLTDSDTHISEYNITAESDDETKEDGRKDTGCRHSTNTTETQPSAHVILHLKM